MKFGIVMVLEDCKKDGIVLVMGVGVNIILVVLDDFIGFFSMLDDVKE